MERIVVGVDGSPASHEALAWALDEARLRQARLEVVYAWQQATVAAFPYGGVTACDPIELEASAKALLDEAMAGADVHGLPQPPEVIPRCGSPVSTLLEQ